ncbi:hypothetical protein BUGL105410_03625 [Burkholderia gladioli]
MPPTINTVLLLNLSHIQPKSGTVTMATRLANVTDSDVTLADTPLICVR